MSQSCLFHSHYRGDTRNTEFTIYSWSWRSSAVEGLYSECECGLHCPVTRTHVPLLLKVTAEAAEVLGGEVA